MVVFLGMFSCKLRKFINENLNRFLFLTVLLSYQISLAEPWFACRRVWLSQTTYGETKRS